MLWQTSGGVNRENCIIYTGNISGNRTWNPHFCPGFSKKRIHGKKADSSGRHTDSVLIVVSCSFWNFYGLFENRASLQEILVESSLGIILCFVIQKVKTKGKNEKKLCAMYSFILEYVDTRMPVLECI